MKGMIDLTIVICAYNAEKYIYETICSLCSQSVKGFYWLIIDDASTDNTLKEVNRAINDYNIKEVSVHYTDRNMGIAYQRNRAMELVSTKYMLYFDADDIAEPSMVEKFYKKLNSDDKIIAVGAFESLIDEDGRPLPGGVRSDCIDRDISLKKAEKGKLFFLPMRSMFVVEEARNAGGINIHGFPDGNIRYADFCEDCDLWTRMSDEYINGKYLIVLQEELVRYRKHSSSVSADSFNMLLKMRYIKNNVRRRRNMLDDLSFIEFYSSISENELNELKKEAHTASLVRRTGFYLQQRKLLKAMAYGCKALFENPRYVFQKIKPLLKRGL